MLHTKPERLALAVQAQHVIPFIKRNKNDRNDAEAIDEAASRSPMRTVPLKTTEEQAATIIARQEALCCPTS